ncbi:MAG TPA: penicillin-binding protein 2 [Candidatus Limnocylindrales bacterium]|nr:penicillin-binding protein 2 [Candidatus Limnocylindrales bacterium]
MGRTDSRRRLLILLVGLVVVAGSLLARLSWWQVVQHDSLAAAARAQTSITVEQSSRRGSIYDRTGTILLATTVDHYRVALAGDQLPVEAQSKEATNLAAILGLDEPAAATLRDRIASRRPYVVLAQEVDEATAARIRTAIAAGDLSNLSLEPIPVRVYPQPGGAPDTSLAAKLMGFVNSDGAGQYGVEQAYQEVLAGRPEILSAQRDASNRAVPGTEEVEDPGAPGVDLRLTIDAGLQLSVEQELLAAWVADHPIDVSAVVMDPYTGEVYAEATYPSYDENDYRATAKKDPSLFLDPVVSSVYEPGSVFKMLTAVAALERNKVALTTKVNDTGILRLDGGQTHVDDADHRAMGWLKFEDVVAWSRNVGAAKVALALGRTTDAAATALHETWTRLGIGRPTGIDVAGEVAGLVHDPALRQWRQIDLANGSFGQGVAVTPIQLATAFSAMVNGGTLVQPHVVAGIGSQDLHPSPQATGVMDPALTPELVGLMHHVVATVPFYRDRTLVPGYKVGGKTGTAQIWDPKLNDGRGGWKVNKFNYSFVGYIGKHRPELIVAVRIREGRPTIARIGELEMPVMSFELFRRIATDAITTLDLDPKRGGPATRSTTGPDGQTAAAGG